MPNFNFTHPALLALALLVCLAVAVFWVLQFVRLMALPDDAFPGTHARFGWVAAFVLLWFLAPFAFLLWRMGESSGQKSAPKR